MVVAVVMKVIARPEKLVNQVAVLVGEADLWFTLLVVIDSHFLDQKL